MARISTGMTMRTEAGRRDGFLREYGLLPEDRLAHPVETSQEPLQCLVELAAKLCSVPYGVVNVVTSDQQRQIAAAGLEPGICAREDSMCAKVFLSGSSTVVEDASKDPRFASNPFVTGDLASVRFYASVPLETSSGFVLGSLCVFSDTAASPSAEQIGMLEILARQVVELLELQRRTLQLNKALDEVRTSNAKLADFAGRVSHDLRSPLTAILGYAGMSEDDPEVGPDHPATRYLQLVDTVARRMLAMLEDVLSYSRVGGGLRPQQTSLRETAAEVAADLRINFGPGAVLDCEHLQLYADPGQLRTLLQNLLVNALNYRSPEREPAIRISGICTDQGATVFVADNGKGIAPEDRLRALDPLVRLHREGDGKGSGLGLAICRRIAQAHGGELKLTETPGGGTTAVITFPGV
ncbi:GAF domain-containing sensor histidine kinase [Arthrobacter sp. NQ7]|uniref:GAF domain-containing sensor histidine kinase n=1 Tax=Arthrobacter sp. NQ7 TaxID=3032303 RepID=UPI00240F03DC|nr:GAF domain-containing sensor histidine kinase [Arthrobacter sp. NQ7]MDJ0457954.1 GAF domain-containing sensor histidine kinase [Arthrobacter sp. NQ7]